MRITHAIKVPLTGLACAAALTLGLVAFPAPASAAQATVGAHSVDAAAAVGLRAPAQALGRWITIGHDSHTPTKFWSVNRKYKSKSKTLQVVFRCWDGGDKTKIAADLRRVITGDVDWPAGHSSWFSCGNGRKHYLKIKAKKGTNYRPVFSLKGRKHTIEYWMQNEL
ncbi:hypothetical protein ACIBIZ_35865 [Nonomuraea spiralis]|uniref:hypothetical protein n=1 Tax=Nonomuraea spiralis TaxID=46182 RepID=UPI0037878C36